jgi:hypothetical protein
MKYQKPIAHDLSELSFADGACSSGTAVGVCSAIAGGLAGRCAANGSNAGTCTNFGSGVNAAGCVPGTFGTASNCQPSGSFATP